MQDIMGNMMGGGAWGSGMMIFMTIFWIVTFALIIVAIIYLVRQLQGGGGLMTTVHETPLDILKKRYAKGEIDKEEFEEKKKGIMGV